MSRALDDVLTEAEIDQHVRFIYEKDGIVDFLSEDDQFMAEKLKKHDQHLEMLVRSIFAGPSTEIVPKFDPAAQYDRLTTKWQNTLKFIEYLALQRYQIADEREIGHRTYHVHAHFAAQWAASFLSPRTRAEQSSIVIAATLLHDVVEETVTPLIREYKGSNKDQIAKASFKSADYRIFKTISEAAEEAKLRIVTDRRDTIRYRNYEKGLRAAIQKDKDLEERLRQEGITEEEVDYYFSDLVPRYVDRFESDVLVREDQFNKQELGRLQRELEIGLNSVGLTEQEARKFSGQVSNLVLELTRPGSEAFDDACKGLSRYARIAKGADCLANAHDVDRRPEDPLKIRFQFRENSNGYNLPDDWLKVRNFLIRANRAKERIEQRGSRARSFRKIREVYTRGAHQLLKDLEYNLVPVLQFEERADTWGYTLLAEAVYQIAEKNREHFSERNKSSEKTHMDLVDRIFRVGKSQIYLARISEENAKETFREYEKIREALTAVNLQGSDDIRAETVSLYLGRGKATIYENGKKKEVKLFSLDKLRQCWLQYKDYRRRGGLDVITRSGGSGFDIFEPIIKQRVKGNKTRMKNSLQTPDRVLQAGLALYGLAERYSEDPEFYLQYDTTPTHRIEVRRVR